MIPTHSPTRNPMHQKRLHPSIPMTGLVDTTHRPTHTHEPILYTNNPLIHHVRQYIIQLVQSVQQKCSTTVVVSTHQQPIHDPPRVYTIVQQYRSISATRKQKKQMSCVRQYLRTAVQPYSTKVCSVRYRYSRYRNGCHTEVTEVSDTVIGVVPNLPKCPVPVSMLYQTDRSV